MISRPWSPTTKIIFTLVALFAAAWLFGLVHFLRAPGVVAVTLPVQAEEPAEEHNLASWRWGPTVRVSSYHQDPFAQHHPAFLVDERVGPSLLEKWATTPEDAHPWAEILWRAPHAVTRVVLRHAGEYESDGFTMQKYTVTCLLDAGPGRDLARGPQFVVNDNEAKIAVHPLACAGARGLRLDTQPRAPNTPVRLYEIEVWGQ
jgi:hypothetical protein